MKKGKGLIAFLLCGAMLVQTFGVPVFASEGAEQGNLYREEVAGGEELVSRYPGGAFELLNGSFDMREGDGEQELVILRRGGCLLYTSRCV